MRDVRYGQCELCLHRVAWGERFCARCERKMEWCDEHPDEEYPDEEVDDADE